MYYVVCAWQYLGTTKFLREAEEICVRFADLGEEAKFNIRGEKLDIFLLKKIFLTNGQQIIASC